MNKLPNVLFQEHSVNSYSVNLPKALAAMGVTVNLFTGQLKRKELTKEGINVQYYPLSKFFWVLPTSKIIFDSYTYHPWFLKTIKKEGINVLHVNVASKSEMHIKAKKAYGLPIVYTNHYVPEPEPLESYVNDFEINEKEKYLIPQVCEQASEVVTVSEYAKNRLKKEFGIDSICIYHGVDLNQYNPSIPVTKTDLGFDPEENIVLWVARLGHHPYKDPFTFIRAIPLILKKFPKTRFVMIGKGFLKPYVVNLAQKLSVYNHVTILDFVDCLNKFYAASDVFVLPTFNDNFGLVVSEAMACGKPVVVSNRGAPQEFVRDSGLLFEYGSYLDLAEKIITLLENEDLRKKLGTKAHNVVAKHFTWEKAAKKYADVYQKIL